MFITNSYISRYLVPIAYAHLSPLRYASKLLIYIYIYIIIYIYIYIKVMASYVHMSTLGFVVVLPPRNFPCLTGHNYWS